MRKPAQQRVHGLWIGVAISALGACALLARPAAVLALALCAAAVLSALVFGELLASGERVRLASVLALGALLLGLSQLRAAALNARARTTRAHRTCCASRVARAAAARAAARRLRTARTRCVRRRSKSSARPDMRVAPKPWQFDLIASEALARRPAGVTAAAARELAPRRAAADRTADARRTPAAVTRARSGARRALYPVLLPWGLYHQVSSSAVSRSDERFAARDADTRGAALDAALYDEPALRTELAERLAASARADADYYAAAGDPEHAARAGERARALAGEHAP